MAASENGQKRSLISCKKNVLVYVFKKNFGEGKWGRIFQAPEYLLLTK